MKDIIILGQIVGVFALATYILSYQQKKRENIILVNAISSALYVLQYIILGAFEGAALDVLSVVSTVAAHNKDKGFILKHTKLVIIIINIIMVISGLFLYKNIFSLFPVIGAMLQNGAFWITEEKKIRIVSLVGGLFWFGYNLVSRAYVSVIGGIFFQVSIIIAIYRYDYKGKKV